MPIPEGPAGLLVFLVPVCLAAGLGVFTFRNLGGWLTVDDALHHGQGIVVMAGGLPYREMEAARLYRAGWASEVWLTEGSAPDEKRLALEKLGLPATPDYENNRSVLIKLGVSPDAIKIIPGYVDNTVEELGAVFRYAKPASIEGVIIVTTKAHSRRVRITWKAVSGGRMPAAVRFTPDDPFDPVHWWRVSIDARVAVREAGGILNAWAGFPIAPRKQ